MTLDERIELAEKQRLECEREIRESFHRKGYSRIHSRYLGSEVYIAKDETIDLPDKTLPVYYQRQMDAVRRYSTDEFLTLRDVAYIVNPTNKDANAKPE